MNESHQLEVTSALKKYIYTKAEEIDGHYFHLATFILFKLSLH